MRYILMVTGQTIQNLKLFQHRQFTFYGICDRIYLQKILYIYIHIQLLTFVTQLLFDLQA